MFNFKRNFSRTLIGGCVLFTFIMVFPLSDVYLVFSRCCFCHWRMFIWLQWINQSSILSYISSFLASSRTSFLPSWSSCHSAGSSTVGFSVAGFRLLVYCNNAVVVSSLNSGCVQDSILAACLRELWFLAASHEFGLRAVHLSSGANRLADLLSRWH